MHIEDEAENKSTFEKTEESHVLLRIDVSRPKDVTALSFSVFIM